MRILHVVPSYIPAWRYGGPIRSVHGLCTALAARGHEVTVATTSVNGPGDSDVPIGVPVILDGVRVHYFQSRRFRRLCFSPAMYRFMESSMPQWDIVHTHSIFLWPTSAAAHLARRFGRPYVLSPRGMLVGDLISRRNALLKHLFITLVERRNVARAAAIHVTSALEATELLALGLSPRRMFEIPNGFDSPFQHSENEPHSHDRGTELPNRYVLFLGRISWKKGLDRLIAALPAAPDATLVVAGNDEEGLWPHLSQHAARISVANRIRYIGYVDGQRKRALIAGASMLVLPSYSENFGNAVLEAMAEGVPVVVTPEVGLASVVSDSRSGLVVGGDPDSLGGAMARMLRDEELRAALGRNAREAARSFSWASIASRVEAEYKDILDENTNRTRT